MRTTFWLLLNAALTASIVALGVALAHYSNDRYRMDLEPVYYRTQDSTKI